MEPHPSDGAGPPEGRADEEDAFDRYLDAALGGAPEDPESFLARHPGASPALRARIEALGRAAKPPRPRPGEAPDLLAGADLPFERLGDFRLLSRLGEGGMGTVYRAEQTSLRRVVALKVVRSDLRDSASAAARFEREARAAARLQHPNIVALHAVGETDGVRWLAMDLVPGRALSAILEECARDGLPPPVADALRWGAEIAEALHCAHTRGIVHRDVKPSNILVTPEGRAMLLDFGVAREIGADGPTIAGNFVGSPVYAAPEQVSGGPGAVGPRTDVYSLGATVYECLTGRPPVAAGTIDRVFHRILAETATAPRRIDPSIPRDAEVVVQKAMEKDPAKRYESAAALAEDLRALLAFRSIRARAPGAAGRAWRWARRNPAAAAATAALAVTLVAGAAVAVVSERSARGRAREEARQAVAEARSRLDAFRQRASDAADAERELTVLEGLLVSQFMRPEQNRRLDALEGRAAALRRDREATFHLAMDDLRRAERIDPGVAGTDEVRGLLYLERWREAVARGDATSASFYGGLVTATDPGGDPARDVAGVERVSIVSDPAGAEVFVHRCVEQADVVPGGERRVVPVPLAGQPPVHPGTLVAEVTSSAGDLSPGDLLTSIAGRAVADVPPWEVRDAALAGGVGAEFVRGGTRGKAEVPAGTAVRVTAAPLLNLAECRVGVTPIEGLELRAGEYLLLLRAEGCADQRVAVVVGRNRSRDIRVSLARADSAPPGFVRVARPEDEHRPAFWLMEREVTVEEYARFLDDEATRREIDASGRPIRFPRGTSAPGGHWTRRPDGTFEIPAKWRRWPVLGISRDDARAYAAWLTSREPATGGRVYALPTFEEFLAATQGGTTRAYVFGSRFRPRWTKSCFSAPQASPEPVLSYPVDESVVGAFDLAGSTQEFCDSWYDEGRGFIRVAGGDWGEAKPEVFQCWGGGGAPPSAASDVFGFRLVVREAAR